MRDPGEYQRWNIFRVVRNAYISGPYTTYILVYAYILVFPYVERIMGATITTHARYTTYILVYAYILVFPYAKRICLQFIIYLFVNYYIASLYISVF